MAIARKAAPKTKDDQPVISEKDIDALINKGGSSTKANQKATEEEDYVKPVLLKVYQSQIRDIEDILSALPKRQQVSRHAYIIQAIDEKIQRDKGKRK